MAAPLKSCAVGSIKRVSMDLRIGHLTFSLPRADANVVADVPAEPPADALREVDRAAARAEELWREDRELHFETDDDAGRVIVQVRDRDGRVIRTMAPSEALDVLAGKPL